MDYSRFSGTPADYFDQADDLPDGIEFDGVVHWSTCPECGCQQSDMGKNSACEECGYGPMPTMDK